MMIGFQYQLAKNLYSTLRLNAAVYDYLDGDQNFSFTEYLTGAALTLGFDSGIGPISVSTMYCTEADKLYGYVNLGFPFR
jgi:NTE family protein